MYSIHENDFCLQNIIDEVKQNSRGEYLRLHLRYSPLETDFEYYYKKYSLEEEVVKVF